MIGRILRSVDFERVLASPICARSPHFAVHFLAGSPSRKARPTGQGSAELSTAGDVSDAVAVDDFSSAPTRIWLGSVVPKRHARRAVTRALLKRQIRHAVGCQAERALGRRPANGTGDGESGASLAHGLWVIRLRAPFDTQNYRSASSEALRQAAAQELGKVLAHAANRVAA